MIAPPWWRRVRRQFGISVPQMMVRPPLPWWGRGIVIGTLLAIVAGTWWWGFDFGQILGGWNRQEVQARLSVLEADSFKHQTEAQELRARNTALESQLTMNKGTQDSLGRQTAELADENRELREELAFLQKLVLDSSKQSGIQIQRLSLEPEGEDMWRYRLLVVRGGSPKDEFDGNLVLQAAFAPAPEAPPGTRSGTLTLPDDQPAAKSALALKFKYYQRVEGRIHAPAGTRITALTVRCYESGQGSPRATRDLQVS